MGHIYIAEDSKKKEVAVKFFSTRKGPFCDQHKLHDHCQFRAKLQLEGRILKSLRHVPSVVNFIDEAGSPIPDDYFLVMDKIDGVDLDKKVSKSQPMNESTVIKISLELAKALKELHKLNIYHRDIKPANIMLKTNNVPVLLDFGAGKIGIKQLSFAEADVTRWRIFTEGWSCHHHEGCRMSHQCDLLALGRIIFYLATSERPADIRDNSHQLIKSNNASGQTKCETGEFSQVLNARGKTLLRKQVSSQLADLVEDLLDPDHKKIQTASSLIQKLEYIQTKPASGPKPLGAQRQRISQPVASTPHIVFSDGVASNISLLPHGTLIGKIHATGPCEISGEHLRCNKNYEGTNITKGWKCPPNCGGRNLICYNNMQHYLPRHHLRIWKDGGVFKLYNNTKGTVAARRSPGGSWQVINGNQSITLNNDDEVAPIYVKPDQDIPMSFKFHTS